MVKANLIKVKVYPKDLKSIPDILPFNKLLHGDPVELELDKKEILRCMNFGDVFDITTGEEVLIDEISFKEIQEFVEEESENGEETNTPSTGDEEENTDPDETVEDTQAEQNSEAGAIPSLVNKTVINS